MMKLSRIPETISYDGAELAAHAERVCGDKELLATLKNKAENYLKKDSADVTKRRIKADNGDPHEYASMGPYWWPNPNTENGLPYVRRDGEVNPETKEPNGFGEVFNSVKILTLAAYYFDEPKYAEKAGCKRDMWHEVRVDGSIALKSALDYISQYATDLTGFEYQEISGNPSTAGCAELLTMAAREYPDEKYYERACGLYTPDMLFRLLPV